MGAGRRTETVVVDSASSSAEAKVNQRGLPKQDLGGVIFVCSNDTMQECLTEELFGLPAAHRKYVQNIEEGLPLFLFNYDGRLLHGIFKAASKGGWNLNPHAWSTPQSKTSRFPAQVYVRLDRQCSPLQENVYSKAIKSNYYAPGRFMFELTKTQARELMRLFSKTGLPPSAPLQPAVTNHADEGWSKPKKPLSWKQVVVSSSSASNGEYLLYPASGSAEEEAVENYTGSSSAEEEAVQNDVGCGSTEEEAVQNDVGCGSTEEEAVQNGNGQSAFNSDEELFSDTASDHVASDVAEKVLQNEEHGEWKTWQQVQEPPSEEHPDLERIMENLKIGDPEQRKERTRNPVTQWDMSRVTAERERLTLLLKAMDSSIALAVEKNLRVCASSISEMRECEFHLNRAMEELRAKGEYVKELDVLRDINASITKSNAGMADEINSLKAELSQLRVQIQKQGVSTPKRSRDLYLIGGFDGTQRLSSVEILSPSRRTVKAAGSLRDPRSCAAAAVLREQIFVFGGVNGSTWNNSVEKYDPILNKWSSCAPMNLARGMLAGVAVGGKLFALGGRNCNTFYSEVEVFDLELGGAWFPSGSMLERRCSMAAVEVGGAIYAFGGTNGPKYHATVERFDPRESIWTQVSPMFSKRVWLSAAVLNGKIYAVGGFDGDKYLNSVERFDPRAGKWEMVQPIGSERAHAAAAVLDDTICLVGGLDRDNQYSDNLECYKEAAGWEIVKVAGLKSRSLMSVAVL